MKALKRLLNLEDNKSKTIIKNAFYSFFIKGVNLSVSFLTIPLVLSFLNTTQYGVWLTLTAVLGWFSLFDLGFGNGLRNHLTVAITKHEFKEAKIYVSTTYAALAAIFGALILFFLLMHPFINWVRVFNAPAYMSRDINNAVVFATCFLFVQFIVRLINTVLLSFQRAAMADFSNTLIQIVILIGLYILKIAHLNSLTLVAIVYSATPILVFLIISIALYLTTYSNIRPSISFVKTSYVGKMLKLGLSFFIIQIAGLVLYTTDNFIIAQYFKPANVTTYNIAFKYFSISTIIFTIALTPFWSMTTKAFHEGDLKWIRMAVKKLLILWMIISVAQGIQLVVCNPLYDLWTSNKVTVPFELSVTMCFYSIIMNWSILFANFQNGVGKVRLQLYLATIAMVINIPLSIYFIKTTNLGVMSVPLATLVSLITASVFASIQYNKIINNTATGIWNM